MCDLWIIHFAAVPRRSCFVAILSGAPRLGHSWENNTKVSVLAKCCTTRIEFESSAAAHLLSFEKSCHQNNFLLGWQSSRHLMWGNLLKGKLSLLLFLLLLLLPPSFPFNTGSWGVLSSPLPTYNTLPVMNSNKMVAALTSGTWWHFHACSSQLAPLMGFYSCTTVLVIYSHAPLLSSSSSSTYSCGIVFFFFFLLLLLAKK